MKKLLKKSSNPVERNRQFDKIISKISSLNAGVFIDDANLYHAQMKAGWRVDWKKVKSLLAKYCKITLFNYHVAIPNKSDSNYLPTLKYLEYLKNYSTIKPKPLKYIKTNTGFATKGDVDLEIAIDVVRNIERLDAIIIIAGDSDYLELKNWVVKDNKKKLMFFGFERSMAWEIKYCWHLYFDSVRNKIELKNNPRDKARGSDATMSIPKKRRLSSPKS